MSTNEHQERRREGWSGPSDSKTFWGYLMISLYNVLVPFFVQSHLKRPPLTLLNIERLV